MRPVRITQLLLTAALTVAAALPVLPAAAQTATTLSRTATINAQATVTGIDAAKRIVTIKLPDGESRPVEAGPDVRNFDQIAVGDTVEVRIAVIGMLDMRRPNADTPKISIEDISSRAPLGEKPSGFRAQKVTAVVNITAIDAEAGEVTFVGPLGNAFTVVTPDAAIKATMRDFRVGELVQASYVETVSIDVLPKK